MSIFLVSSPVSYLYHNGRYFRVRIISATSFSQPQPTRTKNRTLAPPTRQFGPSSIAENLPRSSANPRSMRHQASNQSPAERCKARTWQALTIVGGPGSRRVTVRPGPAFRTNKTGRPCYQERPDWSLPEADQVRRVSSPAEPIPSRPARRPTATRRPALGSACSRPGHG